MTEEEFVMVQSDNLCVVDSAAADHITKSGYFEPGNFLG